MQNHHHCNSQSFANNKLRLPFGSNFHSPRIITTGNNIHMNPFTGGAGVGIVGGGGGGSSMHINNIITTTSTIATSTMGNNNGFGGINNKGKNDIRFVDILRSNGRYSDSFVDFLCHCLKIDPEQRDNVDGLLAHDFLNENHKCFGPMISLSEIINMENMISNLNRDNNNNNQNRLSRNQVNTDDYTKFVEKQLEKFIEALKVVFMNKDIKRKFDSLITNKALINKKRITPSSPSSSSAAGAVISNNLIIDSKKLAALALELDIPLSKLCSRIEKELTLQSYSKDKFSPQ